jgi:hypothetical protein
MAYMFRQASNPAIELADAKVQIAKLEEEIERLRAALPEGWQPPSYSTTVPVMRFQGVKLNRVLFEEIVLIVVCALMLLLWVLPLIRPFKHCCETRLHKVYPMLTLFNLACFALTINYLCTITFNDFFFWVVAGLESLISKLEQALLGLAGLFGCAILWKFKDRILEFLGVDNAASVFGEFRDWATCWSMKRFHAIELFILKVEGLPSVHIHGANDVFCEVSLGYNVAIRTRVHNKAGHACTFKETVQLNFDPFDTENKLTLAIKNQEIIGSTDIAQVQLGAEQIRRLEEPLSSSRRAIGWGPQNTEFGATAWMPATFKCIDLVPAGRVFIRIVPVPEEESNKSSFFSCA